MLDEQRNEKKHQSALEPAPQPHRLSKHGVNATSEKQGIAAALPVEVCEGMAQVMASVEHAPTNEQGSRKKEKKAALVQQPVPPLNVKAAANLDAGSSPDQPSKP